jgi:phage shock protein PspC (stress-responsive transcriptional regulator)
VSDQPQTTQAPPHAAPRRLVRIRQGRIVAGVFTGLGAYTGTDPVLWRIGFIVLAIATGGLALIGYLAAVIFVPEGDPGDVPPQEPSDSSRTARWLGLGALVVGVLILSHNLFDFSGGVFWGLLLVGLGVAMWVRNPSDDEDGPRPASPPPLVPSDRTTVTTPHSSTPEAASGAGAPPQAQSSAYPPQTPPPGPPAPPVPPVPQRPRRRRERSMLGRLVIGAAALLGGTLTLLHSTGAWEVPPRFGMSLVLAVLGAGLLVGAWWGRARWLIFPGGILALLVLSIATLPAFFFDGGAGQVGYDPATLADVRSEYRHGAGEMIVDLSRVTFDDPRTVNVRLGMGEVLVIVPEDVPVRVEARVGVGEMTLLGHQSNGLGLRDNVFDRADGPGELRIRARVGMGQLTVARPSDATAIARGNRRAFRIDADQGRIEIETGREALR